MIKKLVTAGCSFTKDCYQKTWADYLSQELDCDLINAGARGAGLDFISKRLMVLLNSIDPSGVLVGVMLPSIDRFDCYIDSAHATKSHLLSISSWQNGENPLFVTLDGELSTQHGYCLTGGEPRGIKKYWYKYYYNSTAAYINYWFNIINIQNFLVSKGFQYFFTSAYDLDSTVEQPCNQDIHPVEYTGMMQLVNFDPFVLYQHNQGFLSFVEQQGHSIIKHHPIEQAHCDYVQQIIMPQIARYK
jgi:hypothetical protein